LPDLLPVLRAGFSPLKGTRHLAHPTVRLQRYGAVGDRGLCLVDVAARRVLRTVQHPTLTAVIAQLEGDALSLTLPDGAAVTATPTPTGERLVCDYWGRDADLELLAGPHDALLSAYLGKPVRLAAAPPRAVIYGGGVTLVTRATLDDLAARAGAPIDPARFRATLVVDSGEEPFAEDGWEGRELAVGEAVVRVTGGIPRCAVIDIDPVTGERNGRLLRSLASYRPLNDAGEPCFGVYAEVVVPGLVRGMP
jgi:uncharacterized protein YcbX